MLDGDVIWLSIVVVQVQFFVDGTKCLFEKGWLNLFFHSAINAISLQRSPHFTSFNTVYIGKRLSPVFQNTLKIRITHFPFQYTTNKCIFMPSVKQLPVNAFCVEHIFHLSTKINHLKIFIVQIKNIDYSF